MFQLRMDFRFPQVSFQTFSFFAPGLEHLEQFKSIPVEQIELEHLSLRGTNRTETVAVSAVAVTVADLLQC